MLFQGLIDLMGNSSAVQAAIGPRDDGTTGIFAGQMPPEAPPPVIVYLFAYETNEMTMDGPDSFTTARIELWFRDIDYDRGKKLARAVKKLFESFTGTLSDGSEVDSIHRISELDTFDDGPFMFLTSQEYQVSYRDLSP
jgi:hypothetical protein